MLKEYLNASTIHGLHYLGAHRGPVRILWSAFVAASFGLAAWMIQRNILSWKNQPSVVSSVEYELAEGKTLMPKVMICPRTPNPNEMFRVLMLRHPELVKEETARELGLALLEGCLRSETLERPWKGQFDYWTRNKVKPDFQACAAEDSEPCRLVRVLDSLISVQREWFGSKYDSHGLEISIIKYLASIQANSEKLSIESFRDFMKKRLHSSQDKYSNRVSDAVEKLYLNMFPLYNMTRNEEGSAPSGVLDFKGIKEFRTRCKMAKTVQELATSLYYIIETGILEFHDESYPRLQRLKNLVSNFWFGLLKDFLDIDNDEQVMAVVDMMTYGKDARMFQSKKGAYRANPCGPLSNLSLACDLVKNKEAPSEDERQCLNYCDSKSLLNAERRSKIVDLLWMGMEDSHGAAEGNDAMNISNVCKVPNEEKPAFNCFNHIFNDRGICFKTDKDKVDPKIRGTGQKNSFQFTVDSGGSIMVSAYLQKESGVVREFLPPGKIQTKGGQARLFDVLLSQSNYFTDAHEQEETTKANTVTTEFSAVDIPVQLTYILEGTEEFRNLAPERRNCYFPNEKILNYFPIYSEGNCYLECVWEVAKERCGCVPWFLSKLFPEVSNCETYGNDCFKTLVDGRYENRSLFPHCVRGCLSDCERVEYRVDGNYKTSESPSQSLRSTYGRLKKQALSTGGLNLTVKLESLVEESEADKAYETIRGDEDGDEDFAGAFRSRNFDGDELLSHVVQVNVFVSQKLSLRIVKTATMTLVDMVCNIGGAAGLFCGFSLLSGVELAFWGCRAVFNAIPTKATCRNGRKT